MTKTTMDCPLITMARQNPDQPYILRSSQIISYQQMAHVVHQLTTFWSELGVKTGDRILIYRLDPVLSIKAMWAAWRLGVVCCLLHDRYPLTEIARQCVQLQVDFVVTDGGDLWQELVTLMAIKPLPCDQSMLTDLFAGELMDEQYCMDLLATIMQTSGTTHQPKAAMHSWGQHYWSARGSETLLPLTPNDRWFLNLPLYHVAGLSLLFRTAIAGASLVIPSGKEKAFSEVIQKGQTTHVSVVPLQLKQLLDESDLSLDSLKAILVGGAKCPRLWLDKALKRKWPIHLTYGLTEMSSQVLTTARLTDADQIQPKVLDHVEVKLDQVGQILVRGRSLFLGYCNDAGELDPAVDNEGWFHTGDLGVRLDDEQVMVIGRLDDLIISGGENIQPEEIENVLLRVPGVDKVCVFGVEHPDYGQRPLAVLSPFADQTISMSQVKAALDEHLPNFKHPDGYYHWPVMLEKRLKVSRNLFQKLWQTHGDDTSIWVPL